MRRALPRHIPLTTLNLLGLEVVTPRISVDVNAVTGEGNLAGNLVCAIAGLLNGSPDDIGEISDQLNDIVNKVGVAPPSDQTAEAEGTEPADESAATYVTPEVTVAAGAEPSQAGRESTVPAAEPMVPRRSRPSRRPNRWRPRSSQGQWPKRSNGL